MDQVKLRLANNYGLQQDAISLQGLESTQTIESLVTVDNNDTVNVVIKVTLFPAIVEQTFHIIALLLDIFLRKCCNTQYHVSIWIKKLILIILCVFSSVCGSLVLALASQVSFYLPFDKSVPVTLQTFAVLLVGSYCGPYFGTLSVCLYLLEGLAGAPFFASGARGVGVFYGPTAGYLIGFIPACFISGMLNAKAALDRRLLLNIVNMLLCNGIIYTCGLVWLLLKFQLGWKVFTIGLFPFLLGDAIKITAAIIIIPLHWRALMAITRFLVQLQQRLDPNVI